MIEAHSGDFSEKEIIERLARIKVSQTVPERKMVEVASGKYALKLDIEGLVDIKQESERLKKEEKKMEELLNKTRKLLANKKFVAGASGEVVAAAKDRQKEYEEKIKVLKESLKNLQKL